MSSPLVSVIIPNYNYGAYLGAAIESVVGQTHKAVECIVVDDGSTDDSLVVASRYGSAIKVHSQKNEGVSAARNRGVGESSGDWVAFLDADDVWSPRKIEEQLAEAGALENVGLVHCGMREVDAAGSVVRTRIDGLGSGDGSLQNEMLLLRRTVVIGAGSTALVPRSVFEEVGGFDNRLSTSADWDFCLRVIRRRSVGFVPQPLVDYRLHGSNMHSNVARQERDMLLAYEKAFAQPDPEALAIKRAAYARLHMTLAGSYFVAKRPVDFARHAVRSLWLSPGTATHLLGYPARVARRALARSF